jgi:hypothetical protein
MSGRRRIVRGAAAGEPGRVGRGAAATGARAVAGDHTAAGLLVLARGRTRDAAAAGRAAGDRWRRLPHGRGVRPRRRARLVAVVRAEPVTVKPYHPRRCPTCGVTLRTGMWAWAYADMPHAVGCCLDCARALRRPPATCAPSENVVGHLVPLHSPCRRAPAVPQPIRSNHGGDRMNRPGSITTKRYVETTVQHDDHWALADPNDPILGRIAEVCIHWPDDEPESLRA